MAIADLQRFKEILPSVKSTLFVLPERPSLDIVASGLALSLALAKNGLAATVSSPVPMTVEFNRLVGVNQIRQDLGDKNLVLSFANYQAQNIERVAYNIENGEFALTIVPKPGNVAPLQEQIKASWAGVSADLVVAVGTNYPADLGRFAENKDLLERPNLALLSNKPLAGWPRAIELIDASSSSVSEVTQEIIKELGMAIDEDIATNLLLGMEEGTKNFTALEVSAQTFLKAAELLKAGGRRVAPVQEQTSPFATFNQGSRGTPADITRSQFRDSTNIG